MRKTLMVFFMIVGIAAMIFGVAFFIYAIRKGNTFLYALLEGGGISFFGFIILIVAYSEGNMAKKKKG